MLILSQSREFELEVPRWAEPLFDGKTVANKMYLFCYGGRGRGASESMALYHALDLMRGRNVLCLRETQKSITDSNIGTMKKVIERSGLSDYFHLQKHTIIDKRTGAHTSFQGVRQNYESLMSISGYQSVWFEQAEQLKQDVMDVIIPSFREDGQTLSFCWNPVSEEDPIEILRKNADPALAWDPGLKTFKDNWKFPENKALVATRDLDLRSKPDLYNWIWEGGYRPVGARNPFGHRPIVDAVAREPLAPRTPDLVSGVDVAYTDDGDYTAIVTLDEAGNDVFATRFREEDPEERNEAVYKEVYKSFIVMVDTTEAAGTSVYLYLKKRGVNAHSTPFSRKKKKLWVDYAGKRMLDERATLNDPDLIREVRLYGEFPDGTFHATVGNDDLVSAWLLGMEALRQWENARRLPIMRI